MKAEKAWKERAKSMSRMTDVVMNMYDDGGSGFIMIEEPKETIR